MIRYPHTLTFKWNAQATLVNGRPTTDGAESTIEVKCRYDINGSGKFISSESGVNIAYAFKIHSARLSEQLPAGATVEIEGVKYAVIRHDNLQLSSRIWV